MFNLSILDADELLALGTLDLENDKVDAGLIKIKTAMTKDNCPHLAHALIAKIYAQIKLFSKAEQHYQTFLQENPNALNEKFQLGMIHLEKGDPQTALSIWAEVLKNLPTHPPALFYSALAYLNTNNIEHAKRNLDVILQSAPDDNLYFGRARELLNTLNENAEGLSPVTPNPAEVYNIKQ